MTTESLPRILCLHGGGTNARIFRAQCRVLERSLSSTYRFVYAEAPFPSKPGSDVTAVYSTFGPFRAWLRWRPEDPALDTAIAVATIERTLTDAMREDDKQGGRGEWIAILGFSQGAKLAASILFDQQFRSEMHLKRRKEGWPEFRFGILLAGRGPLVSLTPESESLPGMTLASSCSVLSASEERDFPAMETLLQVPTIHVHGMQDPGLELHRKLLLRCCDVNHLQLIQWDGNHRIPIKSKDVSLIIDAIVNLAYQTDVKDNR